MLLENKAIFNIVLFPVRWIDQNQKTITKLMGALISQDYL